MTRFSSTQRYLLCFV